MARITRFLLLLLLAVVGLLNASPKQHVFGFGKRAAEALGDAEVDWNAISKRVNFQSGQFTMGFGKRGLNKQFTMGFGKRIPDEELQREEDMGKRGTSVFTNGLGKRLYGLNNLPGLRTIQYMGLGKRGVLSNQAAAHLQRFNLGLGRR
ncbi:hypothetical protein Aduo_018171 [Ancylostoma duodenale]